MVPSISGRSEAFLGVALRAADVARSEDYWVSKPAATRSVRLIGAMVGVTADLSRPAEQPAPLRLS